MLVCPNCNHQNPDGAVQCEACYTPLPTMLECPACGASVQSDASFCGQCGANLAANAVKPAIVAPSLGEENAVGDPNPAEPESGLIPELELPDVEIPDLLALDDLAESDPLVASPNAQEASISMPAIDESTPVAPSRSPQSGDEFLESLGNMVGSETAGPSSGMFQQTQIQTQTVRLIHVQTNMEIEIPAHLSVVHIGKPNDRVPPDIDVSGFADSEVVSRVHADIRVDGDSYYLEDVGSSNGTYVNNVPLLPGNRHRLRTGDRIALGKGDKVSFIVQIS